MQLTRTPVSPESKPNAVGLIRERGARERSGWWLFCHGHKKAPEQSGLCSDAVAEMEGFDLPCGAGRLALKPAPGRFPSALGF